MRAGAVALVALAVTACSTLPEVTPGVCGNGVVEPDRGEDCDHPGADCGAPSTASACRLRCGATVAGTPSCPAGAACGNDGVCHAPGGTLAVSASRAWSSRHLLVGDTTGDHYPELIGVGDNQLEVLLGGAGGGFDSSVLIPNLAVRDVPRAADVNGDHITDVLIPVGIGLYTLVGDAVTTLQPILQDSFALASTGPMILTTVQYSVGVGTGAVPVTENLVALRLRQGPDCPLQGGCDALLLGSGAVSFPAGRKVEQLTRDQIPWARRPGGADDQIEVALAFADDPDTALDESGVFLFHGDAAAKTLVADGQLTGLPGEVSRGAWLADVDGDSRADLLVSTTGGPFGDAVLVAWGKLDGSFETPVYLIGGPGPTRLSPTPIAWARLNGNTSPWNDLITESGVYYTSCIARTCTFTLGSSQDHAWKGAAVTDVNGDGLPDVIAYTKGGSIIDVLLGTGARGYWNEAPITAPGEIRYLRVGDFDGNGVGDIAMVTAPFDVRGSDQLYVSFGRRNEPPPPATYMGYLGTAVTIDRTLAPLPGQLDTIDDLIVLSERTGARGAALVLGSTSKRMIAPLIPSAPDGSFNLVEATVALPLDADGYDDVVVLLSTIGNDGTFGGSSLRIYTSDAAGTLTERTGAGGISLATDNFALRDALWVAIPPHGDDPAMVVGADVLGRVMVMEASCLTGSGCSAVAPHVLLDGSAYGEPTSLHATDLDGDGRLDVIATFKPAGNEPGGAVVWHNRGALGTATTIAAPAGLVYFDATGADLDLDGVQSLFLVARGDLGGDGATGGVYVSEPGSGGAYQPPTRLTALDGAAGVDKGISIYGGDLDGDGLADLALTSGTDRATPRAITVFTQREHAGGIAARLAFARRPR